jgi:hypothetical protein
MKKILIRVLVAGLVLVVLLVVALGLFLDSAIKKGVETVGPELTKVSIKLDSVSLSVLSGAGKIKGLEVGNPEGYKSPTAIKLGSASISVSPGSLLSDKIVIKSIVIESPEITIEGSPTKNNLTKLLENIEAATAGSGTNAPTAGKEAKPARKLQVNEFVLTGAKVNYAPPGLGGKTIPLVVPDIKLTDLGTGPDGITAGDLTQRVISKLTGEIGPVAAQELSKLGKEVLGTASDTAGKAVGEVGKAAKSITDIFKKK